LILFGVFVHFISGFVHPTIKRLCHRERRRRRRLAEVQLVDGDLPV
jgi:hypothetical protein